MTTIKIYRQAIAGSLEQGRGIVADNGGYGCTGSGTVVM